MVLVSTFFRVDEFDCHDGTNYPPELIEKHLQPLCTMLDTIRRAYGSPLKVVSGYRSLAWNAKIDGAKSSRHVVGDGCDITPLGIQGSQRDAAVLRLFRVTQTLLRDGRLGQLGGLGFYSGKWIHVDCRPRPPSGHVAKWDGVGVGSEQTG